jgi:hypothetical protein
VQVDVEVKSPRSSEYQNITWHFRKGCATEPGRSSRSECCRADQTAHRPRTRPRHHL